MTQASESRQFRRQMKRMAAKGKTPTGRTPSKPATQDIKTNKATHAEKLVAVAFVRDGEVHHGFKSHWELRASVDPQDKNPHKNWRGDECGFWTSNERFVTRAEAVPIAVAAGQIPESWLRVGRELLSSDVW